MLSLHLHLIARTAYLQHLLHTYIAPLHIPQGTPGLLCRAYLEARGVCYNLP
jgi:hypothetical protein